jgi:hypothetical protein
LTNIDNEEWIVRIGTNITTKDNAFFSDSNGLLVGGAHYVNDVSVLVQLYKRHAYSGRPIETNYYPMPSAMLIENERTRLTVIGDHAHGCTLDTAGGVQQMEIMLGTCAHYARVHVHSQTVHRVLMTAKALARIPMRS